MQVLRVSALPDGALAAAAEFYARVLPSLNPPRNGEGDHAQHGGGGSPPHAASLDAENPLHHPSGGPPPRAGEDLLIVFPPADHTHAGWRLAAVQQLARDFAPLRVNAVASASEAAIAAAMDYLACAPGLTGQLLELDDAGAGTVVR